MLALGLQAWQWMFLCMVVSSSHLLVAVTDHSGITSLPLVAEKKSDKAKEVLSTIYVEDVDGKIAAIEESLRGDHKPSMKDIKGPRFGLLPLGLGRHHPRDLPAVRRHQCGVLLLQPHLERRRIR